MSKENLKYWIGKFSSGGAFIGLEVGRYVRWRCSLNGREDMDTLVVLRNEDGKEESFWSCNLTPFPHDAVSDYNVVLKSYGFKTLPDNPEPVKTLDEMVPDLCWCHTCGRARPKRGECPKGCVESKPFGAREWRSFVELKGKEQ